jgi:hypothetical protein
MVEQGIHITPALLRGHHKDDDRGVNRAGLPRASTASYLFWAVADLVSEVCSRQTVLAASSAQIPESRGERPSGNVSNVLKVALSNRVHWCKVPGLSPWVDSWVSFCLCA